MTNPEAPLKRQGLCGAKSNEHRLLIRAITELPKETVMSSFCIGWPGWITTR